MDLEERCQKLEREKETYRQSAQMWKEAQEKSLDIIAALRKQVNAGGEVESEHRQQEDRRIFLVCELCSYQDYVNKGLTADIRVEPWVRIHAYHEIDAIDNYISDLEKHEGYLNFQSQFSVLKELYRGRSVEMAVMLDGSLEPKTFVVSGKPKLQLDFQVHEDFELTGN